MARLAFQVEVVYSGLPENLNWGSFKFTSHAGTEIVSSLSEPYYAHTWWPCKASHFHPEDKPEAVRVDVTVPVGLVAVSAGRALPSRVHGDGRVTYRWRLDHAVPTWSVPLAVGPFVREVRRLDLPGIDRPVRFVDMEGSHSIVTEPATIRAEYQTELNRFLERLRTDCHEFNADYRRVTTDLPYDKLLADFLTERAGRGKR